MHNSRSLEGMYLRCGLHQIRTRKPGKKEVPYREGGGRGRSFSTPNSHTKRYQPRR
ncbi:hypothetical protein FOCG_18089 [Fusarium oxysporum f. sp. radicis-lycopersici 26381]|nr:hypothetical protein FOCG_18089 [Fusarium oxysporum f. sp. radicis-lycopersici 26381]